jgi:hypothetical protein
VKNFRKNTIKSNLFKFTKSWKQNKILIKDKTYYLHTMFWTVHDGDNYMYVMYVMYVMYFEEYKQLVCPHCISQMYFNMNQRHTMGDMEAIWVIPQSWWKQEVASKNVFFLYLHICTMHIMFIFVCTMYLLNKKT